MVSCLPLIVLPIASRSVEILSCVDTSSVFISTRRDFSTGTISASELGHQDTEERKWGHRAASPFSLLCVLVSEFQSRKKHGPVNPKNIVPAQQFFRAIEQPGVASSSPLE